MTPYGVRSGSSLAGVWASCQIRKIAGCACAGNVFPRRRFQRKLLVSDPGMHHGTCVTHVPWCMSGSLTCGGGENVRGIPGACAPAILCIWQEARWHVARRHQARISLVLRNVQIDGLVQERCNSSALAMELRLSCTNPSKWVNSLVPSDNIWQQIWVNIGAGNGLLPDSAKPFPVPTLSNHHSCLVAFTSGQFHKKCSRYLSLICL